MTAAAAAALRVGDIFTARGRRWTLAGWEGAYWTEGRVEVQAWALYSDGTGSTVRRRVSITLDD